MAGNTSEGEFDCGVSSDGGKLIARNDGGKISKEFNISF